MGFDRHTLVIPDGTRFDEQSIITNGDVIIGDRCLVQYGIKTTGRIFVGEHVVIDGNLESTGDIRMDIFSRIRGDVASDSNVYLGEKVIVDGRLSVGGDLDVGDSVDVKQGFEAKGWINIRSPIPVVIYIFIYLTQLLKMGHSEDIERILKEIEENDGDTIPISEVFLFIPNNSMISTQKSKTDGGFRIGKNSNILGNYEIKGKAFIGDKTILHGSVHAGDNIFCGQNVQVHGSLESQGNIRIDEQSIIGGNITAEQIHLSKTVETKGTMYAKKGVNFLVPYDFEAAEKIRRFEDDIEIFEQVNDTAEG